MRLGALAGLIVLVLGLAVAAWALLGDADVALHAPPGGDPDARGTNVVAAPASAPLAASAAQPTTEPGRSAAPGAAPATADGRPTATVRGRCVDDTGAPLAGCTVSLAGWTGNQDRMDEWLRDHPQPEWTNPGKQTTGADGAFVFTFWPPPPFQFALDVDRDGCVPCVARWPELAGGTVVDVGDVVLAPGIRVDGVVVDERGRPVPKVPLSLQVDRGDAGREGRGTVPRSFTTVTSDGDGTFRPRHVLPAGELRVTANGEHELVADVRTTLAIERPVATVRVVLRDLDALPSIAGRVVDDAGQPVRAAQIELRDRELGGHVRGARTKRDGTFVARWLGAGPPPALLLAVRHADFEPTVPQPVEWGAQDLVLTVQRAGSLQVHVHDDDGRAIEDFQVRVFPREQDSYGTGDLKVRARGPFPGGIATVTGVARAKWTVVVDFPAASGRAPVFTPIEMLAPGALRVDVRAPASSRRTLLVVDAADRPIAGTRASLTLQVEGQWNDDTMAVALEQLIWGNQRNRALVLSAGTTAADGTLELTGPRGVALGVAVDGPGHVPLRLPGVRLDEPGELVVRVAIGAGLRGKLSPPAAVAELLRLAGGQVRGYEPRVTLVRHAGTSAAQRYPRDSEDPRANVAPDGTFALDGALPGRWSAQLQYWVVHEGAASTRTESLGDVTLRDGETVDLTHDVSWILPGTLSALVLKNGVPMANTQVSVEDTTRGFGARTDASGRFTMPLRAGTWRLVVRTEQRNLWIAWTAPQTATVTAGATAEQTFDLAVGELALTLRDGKGEPVRGVTLQARSAGGHALSLPPTDADGRCRVEWNAQTLTFEVLPRRLLSADAQQRLWREAAETGDADPLRGHLLTIGTATLAAGRTTDVELRLPPEWEK